MADVKDHLALGLDFDDRDHALGRARALREWFGVAKVGVELYAAAGPGIIADLRELGYSVFLDVKLHDIPNTVRSAARVLARYGLGYLNFHTSGGAAMLAAGVEGARLGAAEAGVPVPLLLGVTVLTSDADASAFPGRLALAVDNGCDGVVCSAHELDAVRSAPRRMITMVPGIRLPGAATDDQARIATPGSAIADGADVLVIARTVHNAPDPSAAAQAVYDEVAACLSV